MVKAKVVEKVTEVEIKSIEVALKKLQDAHNAMAKINAELDGIRAEAKKELEATVENGKGEKAALIEKENAVDEKANSLEAVAKDLEKREKAIAKKEKELGVVIDALKVQQALDVQKQDFENYKTAQLQEIRALKDAAVAEKEQVDVAIKNVAKEKEKLEKEKKEYKDKVVKKLVKI